MKSVFEYLDYREFLLDYYLLRKDKDGQRFSWRKFSAMAGYSPTSSQMKMVVDGERNLPPGIASGALGRAMRLGADERRHFRDLVEYTHAIDDPSARQRLLDRLRARARFRQAFLVEGEAFLYYASWVTHVVREMLSHPEFRPDPEWIQRHLRFPAPHDEIASAITTLLELGMVTRVGDTLEDGETGEKVVGTGHRADDRVAETFRDAYRSWYASLVEMGRRSVHEIPAQERHLNSLTTRLTRPEFEAFRQNVNELIEALASKTQDRDAPIAGGPGEVYHLNVQLFPLTRMDPEAAE